MTERLADSELTRKPLAKTVSLPPLPLDLPKAASWMGGFGPAAGEPVASSSSKGGTLYQRMAGPVAGTVQHLMSRSAQSGLLAL